MPPKKTTPAKPAARTTTRAPAKATAGAKKTTTPATKAGAKKAAAPAAKGGKNASPAKQPPKQPEKPKWTPQDEAARKIQTQIRGYLSKKKLEKLKKEKQDYNDLMDKLEKEAFVHLVRLEQEQAEIQRQKEEEERRRKREEAQRKKRVLEAAFDGDIDEIEVVLQETKAADDKAGLGHDTIGKALRNKHLMSMIEASDANSNTALSESASGGHADMIKYLLDKGADPNSRGRFLRTPLYRSAFAGHLEATQILLQYGADPRLFADDGQTPEHIASQKPVTALLQSWDISLTETLLAKLEDAAEQRKEEEKKRREAEQGQIEVKIQDAEEEYQNLQKRFKKCTCELEKRILEHDESAAQGFDKPELTLAAIHEAEAHVEIAKLDLEKSRDILANLKLALREKRHEGNNKTLGEDLPGLKITIRELEDVLLRDVGNKIEDSGRWPLLIDASGQAALFLKYRDTNYLNAISPKEMEPEKIRLALLGAIRYGKPLVLDMNVVDMFDTVSDRIDEIDKGLMDKIMSKDILKEEVYLKLIKESDGEAYKKINFNPGRTKNFKLFVLTKNPFPMELLVEKTYPIRIILPS